MNNMTILLPLPRWMLISGCAILALLVSTQQAHATNPILVDFNDTYTGSSSGDNASCQLCHGSSTSTWNEYGFGLLMNGQDFAALEGDLSINIDNNDVPTTNDTTMLEEINDSTQPGWTTGAINKLYNSIGLISSTQTPPSGIGQLDPSAANIPPIADANGPYSGSAGVPIMFDGTGSLDTDGTIVSYAWDFGDANTGTGSTPAHTYTTDGTYSITLTVTDDAGDTDSDTTLACLESPVAGVTLITKDFFNTGTGFDSDTRGGELCTNGVNGCLTKVGSAIPDQTFPFTLDAGEITLINNTPGILRLSVFLAGDITTSMGSEESVTVEYNGMDVGEALFDESADTCERPKGSPPHTQNENNECGPNFAKDYVAGGNVVLEGIPVFGASDIATNPFGCQDNDRSLTLARAEFLAGLDAAGNGMFTYKLSDEIFQAKYFGSRLEFVAHEFNVGKELVSGPVDDTGSGLPVAVDPFDDGGILIKHTGSQHFSFTIRLSDEGGSGSFVGWKALDVIPAEFDPDPGAEEGTFNNFVSPGVCADSACDGIAVTEGNCTATINPHDSDRKLDPHFVRVELGDSDKCEVTVWVRTSENPASGKRGRNRKFAPTSCDVVMGELLNTFTLNEGVKVFDTVGEFRFSGPTDSLQLTCNQ